LEAHGLWLLDEIWKIEENLSGLLKVKKLAMTVLLEKLRQFVIQAGWESRKDSNIFYYSEPQHRYECVVFSVEDSILHIKFWTYPRQTDYFIAENSVRCIIDSQVTNITFKMFLTQFCRYVCYRSLNISNNVDNKVEDLLKLCS